MNCRGNTTTTCTHSREAIRREKLSVTTTTTRSTTKREADYS